MGIGVVCDIAIALHFGDPLKPQWKGPGGKVNPQRWAYERGRVMGHPKNSIGPGGSANHRISARICDLVSGNVVKNDPKEWRDPRDWLTTWYTEVMPAGHDGFEFLSTVYGGAHMIFAMLCSANGIPGAAEHLQRSLAVYALHLTPEKRLVMPGTRSAWKESPDLEQAVRYLLGEDRPERPKKGGGRVKAQRELVLARRLGAQKLCAASPAERAADLATVRSAPGELVHRQHERGFVSYFPAGPRCYAYPQPAVVAVDGQEPIFVRPPYSPKRGAPMGGSPLTVLHPTTLFCATGQWSSGPVGLSPLGALVRETRIPGSAEVPG